MTAYEFQNFSALKKAFRKNTKFNIYCNKPHSQKFRSTEVTIENICNQFGKTCNYELNNVLPEEDQIRRWYYYA